MSLVALLIGILIIKGFLLWVFYFKHGWKPLLLGLISGIACYPLMTVLYHETDVDFWMVFLFIIIFDIFTYNLLLRKNIAKSIIVSCLLNLLAILFFIIGNG